MSSENTCVSEVTSAITSNKVFTSVVMTNTLPTSTTSDKNVTSFDSETLTSPSSESENSVVMDDALRLRNIRRLQNSISDDLSVSTLNNVKCIYSIPIVGYEIMEERARFTVYKLRIENKMSGDCWFVFRRYTDFVRLFSKLKSDFPTLKLSLPRKRWFGDNFNSEFIEERIQGLQTFVNSVLQYEELCGYCAVKEFFCLNEPPSHSENMEESRAIFEALEETIFNLRCQLKNKEVELEKLKLTLNEETKRKNELDAVIRNCLNCSKELPKWNPQSTSTPIKVAPNAVFNEQRSFKE